MLPLGELPSFFSFAIQISSFVIARFMMPVIYQHEIRQYLILLSETNKNKILNLPACKPILLCPVLYSEQRRYQI